MTQEEKYLHFYETESGFTADYDGPVYHEDWVSLTLEGFKVHYNKKLVMTVDELITAGYASLATDVADCSPYHAPGSESDYQVIQIHSNCPVLLENIPDFDDYLTSSTTYVWREALPSGWRIADVLAKYNGIQLARPPMEQMFCGPFDMSGINELSLSFNEGSWYVCDSSIIGRRYSQSYPGLTYLTPKQVNITIRNKYGTVFQTALSMMDTTTGITLNVGGTDIFGCHDITGLFEGDRSLKTLIINGPFRWDTVRSANNVFFNCKELTSIPHVSAWGRDDEASAVYNTMYPRYDGTRGSADFGGCFNGCDKLTFLGPRIDMKAASWSGCTVDGQTQAALSGDIFQCPLLEDVRIINLNNNNWDFHNPDGGVYIPKMNVASIEFLLNHVVDCSATPHTVIFSDLHRGEVSQSAISYASVRGWNVYFGDPS